MTANSKQFVDAPYVYKHPSHKHLANFIAPFFEVHNSCTYEEAFATAVAACTRYYEDMVMARCDANKVFLDQTLRDMPILEVECRDGSIAEIGTFEMDELGPLRFYFVGRRKR